MLNYPLIIYKNLFSSFLCCWTSWISNQLPCELGMRLELSPEWQQLLGGKINWKSKQFQAVPAEALMNFKNHSENCLLLFQVMNTYIGKLGVLICFCFLSSVWHFCYTKVNRATCLKAANPNRTPTVSYKS